MLCKKCGRELPYAGGKFCPFCGAPVEQTGVSDETEVFTTLPEELRNAGGAPADSGIDLSAFDAARRQSRQALEDAEETMAIDPLADTSEQPAAAPRVPQQRPEARVRRRTHRARPITAAVPARMTAYTASRPRAGAQRS